MIGVTLQIIVARTARPESEAHLSRQPRRPPEVGPDRTGAIPLAARARSAGGAAHCYRQLGESNGVVRDPLWNNGRAVSSQFDVDDPCPGKHQCNAVPDMPVAAWRGEGAQLLRRSDCSRIKLLRRAPRRVSRQVRGNEHGDCGVIYSGILIDCGGPGDDGFDGGHTVDRGPIKISRTDRPALFRTERYDVDSYWIEVPAGEYDVFLGFAETYQGIRRGGQRVFSVSVNDSVPVTVDPFGDTGGRNRASVGEQEHVHVLHRARDRSVHPDSVTLQYCSRSD